MKEYTKEKLIELLTEREEQASDLQKQVEIINEEKNNLKSELEEAQAEIEGLRVQLRVSMREIERTVESFRTLENSFFWKITKPARYTLDCIKKAPDLHTNVGLAGKVVKNVRENGVAYTFRKIKTRLTNAPSYSQWIKKHRNSEKELADQRNAKFSKEVIFSITVPLYNTPESFLKEMIDSVLAQTYSGWELCLADGSDGEHDYVESICKEYARDDNRILYKRLEKNLGISENTNACLEMATGDYIALFDHDDILHPAALYEMMCVIEEKDADVVYTDEATFLSPDINKIIVINFKPDFAPDNLRANNYICHFTAFRHSLLAKTGAFRSEYDGSQDHDLMLRLTENADIIEHIPKVLYFWRAHPASVALSSDSKDYAAEAGREAVKDSIERMGLSAKVESTRILSSIYRIKYELTDIPKISIVIPTCDHVDLLRKCISSIEEKSTYNNYEIVIVENNSKEDKTFEYYKEVEKKYNNIKILYWKNEFNYSAINNFGIREGATGEQLLLLNNDIEVITPNWMEEMLMYSQRNDVGAVGAKLLYPDNTVQHGGVILGKGGIAGHMFMGMHRDDAGYMGRLCYAQNLSAVTAACMMIRRDVWDKIGGLDEGFPVAFNDIDLCMQIRKEGYLIVWTPYAELYHYESKSRGSDDDTPEKRARFMAEQVRFKSRWGDEMAAGDPYYNPNFSLDYKKKDFTIQN